jgi:hypothetical protein
MKMANRPAVPSNLPKNEKANNFLKHYEPKIQLEILGETVPIRHLGRKEEIVQANLLGAFSNKHPVTLFKNQG